MQVRRNSGIELIAILPWLISPLAAQSHRSDVSATHRVSLDTAAPLTRSVPELWNEIAELRDQARADRYPGISPGQLLRFQGLFQASMQSLLASATTTVDDRAGVDLPFPKPLRQAWGELGYDVLRLNGPSANDVLWLLVEDVDHRWGRGVYLLRAGCQSGLVFQAPHDYFDRYTGAILDRLVVETDICAAAWNSAHRTVVDIAHVDHHPIQAFTRAAANVYSPLVVVQLHGFDASKRTSSSARSAQIILSNGSDHPSEWIIHSHLLLRRQLQQHACLLYPTEVTELGATTNAQSALLRAMGVSRFASVEMDATTRRQLLDQPELRRDFFKCWRTDHREHDDK